jgi:hypothetical protein
MVSPGGASVTNVFGNNTGVYSYGSSTDQVYVDVTSTPQRIVFNPSALTGNYYISYDVAGPNVATAPAQMNPPTISSLTGGLTVLQGWAGSAGANQITQQGCTGVVGENSMSRTWIVNRPASASNTVSTIVMNSLANTIVGPTYGDVFILRMPSSLSAGINDNLPPVMLAASVDGEYDRLSKLESTLQMLSLRFLDGDDAVDEDEDAVMTVIDDNAPVDDGNCQDVEAIRAYLKSLQK